MPNYKLMMTHLLLKQTQWGRLCSSQHLILIISFLGIATGCNGGLSDAEIKTRVARLPKRDVSTSQMVQDYLRKNGKVYISLTTSPARISKIHHVLDSLDLSLVEKIFINLPLRFGRDQSEYIIPQNLLSGYQQKVEIIRTKTDLGPIMKLLPAAQKIRNLGKDEPIVMTFDDDTVYPPGTVSEFLYATITNRNTVVSASGRPIRSWDLEGFPLGPEHLRVNCGNYKQNGFSYCDVLEGFAGISYPVRLINIELMKRLSHKKFSMECFTSDDLVISFVLGLSGVNRMSLHNQFVGGKKIGQLSYGFGSDSLHHGAGLDDHLKNLQDIADIKYRECHKKLMAIAFEPSTRSFRSPERVKMEWDQQYPQLVGSLSDE